MPSFYVLPVGVNYCDTWHMLMDLDFWLVADVTKLPLASSLLNSTVALRVVRGDGKGTQCPGVYLGHPVPGRYKLADLALQVGWVSRIGTIKYGLELNGTDRLCGLVVIVIDFRCRGPGFDSRALQKKSSGSGTGSSQPREYNWGAIWWKSSGSCLENREYGRRDPSR
jgi:hypothetical protein